MQRIHRRQRRGFSNLANLSTLGVMVSIALLVTWAFIRRLDRAASPETLLLEFLTTFIVVCGALVVAAAAVGLLPPTRRRPRNHAG